MTALVQLCHKVPDVRRGMILIPRPEERVSLRHIALYVQQLDACVDFYTRMLGMVVTWAPDPDNIYLTSGVDNLALHRAAAPMNGPQRLDHLGFIVATPEGVDAWHAFFVDQGVAVQCAPRTHRDGARSFYCKDPDGNAIQMMYHPDLQAWPVK